MKTFLHKTRIILPFAVVILSVFIYSIVLFAKGTGVANKTAPPEGCTCHNDNANMATSLSASIEGGSFTVAPGAKSKISITVSNTSMVKAGVNIAVKTSQSGSQNAGAFELISSGLKISAGEIVHATPASMSGGQVVFEFYWTAPATEGVYFLRAIANAVDGKNNDSGDQWNWLTPIAINVEKLQGVEDNQPNNLAFAAPNPMTEMTSFSFTAVGDYLVTIIDINGRSIKNFSGKGNSNEIVEIKWDGKDSFGNAIMKGNYIALISSGNQTKNIKLIKH